jgi:hypothetical protein
MKAEVHSAKAVVRMRKTGKFICFNNNVSNLYNNSVVEKIYGMISFLDISRSFK